MKRFVTTIVLGSSFVLALVTQAPAQEKEGSFSFHAEAIQGFPTGQISLTGGGVFNGASGFAHGGGGFSCFRDVNQGPLAGLKAGEGIRWDIDSILPSTTFKCTGAASELPKTATTGPGTVVLKADFYRAGDGTHESFQANMIISSTDLDPARPGIQNVWVQGVGCDEASVTFQ